MLLTYYGKAYFNPTDLNDSEFRHHIDSKNDPDVRLLNKRSGPSLEYEGNRTREGVDSIIEETTTPECSMSTSSERKRVRFSNRIPANKYTMRKYIGVACNNQVNIQCLEGIKRKYKHFKRFGRDNTPRFNFDAIKTEDDEIESKPSSIENLSTLNNRLSFENKYSYNSPVYGPQYGQPTSTNAWDELPQPYTTYPSVYEPMRYVPAATFTDYARTPSYDTYIPPTTFYNGSSSAFGYSRDMHSYGDSNDDTFPNIAN